MPDSFNGTYTNKWIPRVEQKNKNVFAQSSVVVEAKDDQKESNNK